MNNENNHKYYHKQNHASRHIFGKLNCSCACLYPACLNTKFETEYEPIILCTIADYYILAFITTITPMPSPITELYSQKLYFICEATIRYIKNFNIHHEIHII